MTVKINVNSNPFEIIASSLLLDDATRNRNRFVNIKDWLYITYMEQNHISSLSEQQWIPKQNKRFQFNMILYLLQYKPIKKFEALRLNWRLSSWHNDAKNFCRLYARMANTSTFTKRTLSLMHKWAELLIYFGNNAWEINKKLITISNKNSELDMSSFWLYSLLIKAIYFDTLEKLYNVSSGFEIHQEVKLYKKTDDILCSISHNIIDKESESNMKINQRITDYHFVEPPFTISSFIGSKVHKKIQDTIKNGLKRYRSQSAKDKLINEVREHREQSRQKRNRTKIYCP